MTVWEHLREQAIAATERGDDRDTSARELLAAAGGDRAAMLAAHMRFAVESLDAADQLRSRRVLKLIQRAVVLGDTEHRWHPAYSNVGPSQFARHPLSS